MSIHLKTMLESAKRAASATQDAANDCRNAAEAAKRESDEIMELGSDASTQAEQAQERVKVLEAKLIAATTV
jgi:hypothetical protein